jgi:hypothetical protein
VIADHAFERCVRGTHPTSDLFVCNSSILLEVFLYEKRHSCH